MPDYRVFTGKNARPRNDLTAAGPITAPTPLEAAVAAAAANEAIPELGDTQIYVFEWADVTAFELRVRQRVTVVAP